MDPGPNYEQFLDVHDGSLDPSPDGFADVVWTSMVKSVLVDGRWSIVDAEGQESKVNLVPEET